MDLGLCKTKKYECKNESNTIFTLTTIISLFHMTTNIY